MSDSIHYDLSSVGIVSDLGWSGPISHYPMVVIDTIGDGHCFFHALCAATFIPYRTGKLGGQSISKLQIVTDLRRSLATKLSQPIDLSDPTSPIWYELLGGGEVARLAKEGKEDSIYYSLDSMTKRLNSSQDIGHEYFEFIGDVLNVDIYILDKAQRSIYRSADDLTVMYKKRNSVIMLFSGSHYELVGMRTSKGITTRFKPGHPLIEFLYSQLQER